MSQFLPLGKVAEMIGVSSYILSNMFYEKQLDSERCPLVGRVRAIPVDYIPTIKARLKERLMAKSRALAKQAKQFAIK